MLTKAGPDDGPDHGSESDHRKKRLKKKNPKESKKTKNKSGRVCQMKIRNVMLQQGGGRVLSSCHAFLPNGF